MTTKQFYQHTANVIIIPMELNDRQKRFWEIYTGEGELSGNGARCYAEAYGIDISTDKGYRSAKVNASRLIRKIKDAAYQEPESIAEQEETAAELQDEAFFDEPVEPVEIFCIC